MVDVPKHIQVILEYDRLFRSHLLYEAIALENLVDKMIAWYFSAEESKHALMFSLVFREGEIGFSVKIQILRKLLKKAYRDLQPAFGYLPRALDELRVLRNKFAHSEVVLPDDPPEASIADGVTLRYLRGGTKVEEFIPRAVVDRQMEKCEFLQVVAIVLSILIEKRSRGTASAEEEANFKALSESLKLKIQETA